MKSQKNGNKRTWNKKFSDIRKTRYWPTGKKLLLILKSDKLPNIEKK